MKRLCAALVLLAATAGVFAQGGPTVRIRPRVSKPTTPNVIVPAAVRVSIDAPTSTPTFTTTATTIAIEGVVLPAGSSPITTVAWSSSAGGSGSATYNQETGRFATTANAETPVFQDDFEGATNTDVTLLSPDTGASFAALSNTTGSGFMQRRSAGYLQINTSFAAGGSPEYSLSLVPSTAISGQNYTVSLPLVNIGYPGNDDAAFIKFGVVDSDDWCAAVFYGISATTDEYLIKSVAGVLTQLDSDTVDIDLTDTIGIDANGSDVAMTQNGVSRLTATDADCARGNGVAIGVGAIRGVATDDAVTTWRFASVTVTDRDGAAGAIPLSVGSQTITVTATDASSATGTDTIVVTRSAGDTTAPTLAITSPSALPTLNTSTAAQTFSGTADDNIGVTGVTWACGTCTPTSGTATGTTAWSFAATMAAGANTVTVTATDAAANTTQRTITVTLTSGDVTAPSITIAVPTTPFSTTTSPLSLSGTASDAVGVTQVSCASDQGGSAVMSGTTGWSGTLALAAGAQTVTCSARDEANNIGTATVSVTYIADLAVTSPATLSNARVSSAYSYTLASSGGVAPISWLNDATGTTSLGAGACSGLSLNGSTGEISGTPTTEGDCTVTYRATDSAVSPDTATKSITIPVVAAAAETSHTFFEDMIALGTCYKAFSLRPLAGQTTPVSTCAQSRYASQLLAPNQGGYANSNSGALWVTYDPGADTHPQKQDAAKARIPAFATIAQTLAAEMDASTTTMTLSSGLSISKDRGIQIDDEIMLIGVTQATSTTITVIRGAFGTTPAVHTAGSSVALTTNTLPNQVRLPINAPGTTTGTYYMMWDVLWTSSFVNTGLTNQKAFQFTTAGESKSLEIQSHFAPPVALRTGFDGTTDVASIGMRIYGTRGTEAAVSQNEAALPVDAPFIVKPGKWTRFIVALTLNDETAGQGFVNDTTLSASISDTDTTITVPTTMFVDQPSAFYLPSGTAPGCSPTGSTNCWPGRTLRIGTEYMTVVSGPTGSASPKTFTVVRGAHGSTPAAHTAGDAVALSWDRFSVWMADEDRTPALLYDDRTWMSYINRVDTAQRGDWNKWWIELGTSTNDALPGRAARNWEDLVAYIRNAVILKDPSGATVTDILSRKPVRD